MDKRLLLLIYAGCILFIASCHVSTSRKQADTATKDSVQEAMVQEMPSQDIPTQEVPTQLVFKLGELYGDNPPGVVGFSVESKNCPDYIGGIYINDQDTLVIQIRGDSATVRKKLEEALQSKEFIVEPAGAFTQKELMAIQNKLNARWQALEGTGVMGNVKSAAVGINDIEISLIVNTAEKRKEFREKVMDSPAFRFTGPEIPGEDARVGVNDVQGVALRPEYTVYPTDTEYVKFILYNHSGGEVGCGEHYHITYEDENGVWRRLPINDFAVDILYGVENGGSKEFNASLYPDVHPNPPGRYRFFYEVTVGDMQAGDRLTMMAEFRLSNNKQELAKAAKTPIPQTVQGGLTEEEYRKKEEQLFATHVFTVVEVMPEYPDGGHEGLLKYIQESIPKDITKEGRTIISFIVERDGTLSNIEIIRSSSHKELDDEALRIVKKMPKWIPGRQRGKAVRVRFTMPVAFRKK